MMLKKTVRIIFLLYVLCHVGESCAWFFHYNRSGQSDHDRQDDKQEILATLVLLDNDGQHNTCDYIDRLKKFITEKFHAINVIVVRATRESGAYSTCATIANKPCVDAVISVRVVQCACQQPTLYMYRYSWGQEFVTKINEMAFYPAEQAYLFSKDATISWAMRGNEF